MTNDTGFLRVVLLCKGKGADKDSYRPRSDESQWWGRRDALVRCVSSFLFGPKPRGSKKELVLLFDEDFARLRMTMDNEHTNADAFPKEQTILQLWKRASQNLRKPVEHRGMKCVIDLDPDLSLGFSSSSSSSVQKTSGSQTSSSIDRIDTKRAVLEYIQKNVSVEFLREHKINSHPEVVLRKTNRKALLKIWETWTKQQQQELSSSDDATGGHNAQRLQKIYHELLQFPSSTTKVVAGTLHEKCEEFPCFRFSKREQESSSSIRYHVCLFLGAVRDMTDEEEQILEKVCTASNIPLVGVRFGTVPEFTSKILSLLSFHHANNVLGISLKRLVGNVETKEKGDHPEPAVQPLQQSTCLTVVCTVPKTSKEISIDIEKRDDTHWRLVRVVVCSLWRSKLVSSNSRVTHTNVLYLVFDDGIVVCLKERDFVGKLASQHQAAPSEFQILKALLEEIARQSQSQTSPLPSSRSSVKINDDDPGWSRKKLAKRLVMQAVVSAPIPITCVVGIASTCRNTIVSRFYDHASTNPSMAKDPVSDSSIVVVLDIVPPKGPTVGRRLPKQGEDTTNEPRKIYKQLLAASKKHDITTIEQNFVSSGCRDREAASIIALQHMCYQNRVFARKCSVQGSSTKNKFSGEKRKKPT